VGTNFSVNNAIKIAKYLGLSEFFIGLTIISIGTDLPELVVSITGAIHKLNGEETSGLIIGNAIGSCLGQMGLALGLAGLFYRINIDKKQVFRDGLVMGVSIFVLMMLASDGFLSRIEGVLLVVIFLVYTSVLLSQEKTNHVTIQKIPFTQIAGIAVKLIIGLGIVVYSSNWTIRSALDIATHYHIRQSIIGIFIVGLGTSLPEIAVAFGGLLKGSAAISGGTIIGSTIFDILVPIGVSASISTLKFDVRIADFDIPAFLIIALIEFSFFITRKGISKLEAIIILAIFFLYSWLKISQF
jgi:cation:H+ antiporter